VQLSHIASSSIETVAIFDQIVSHQLCLARTTPFLFHGGNARKNYGLGFYTGCPTSLSGICRYVTSLLPNQPPNHLRPGSSIPLPTALPLLTSFWHHETNTNLTGLKNLGATCYINSLVQQLFNIGAFRKAVLSLDVSAIGQPATSGDAESPAAGATASSTDMLLHLQILFAYLAESIKPIYDPIDFCHTYRDMVFTIFFLK
jgi:hypothetical protein